MIKSVAIAGIVIIRKIPSHKGYELVIILYECRFTYGELVLMQINLVQIGFEGVT